MNGALRVARWALVAAAVAIPLSMQESGQPVASGPTFEQCVQTCDIFEIRCDASCQAICQWRYPDDPARQVTCVNLCQNSCDHVHDRCVRKCEVFKPPPSPETPQGVLLPRPR